MSNDIVFFFLFFFLLLLASFAIDPVWRNVAGLNLRFLPKTVWLHILKDRLFIALPVIFRLDELKRGNGLSFSLPCFLFLKGIV